MLGLTDKPWTELIGGYRTAFDPRPALHKLESNVHAKEAWHELWEELHHQGDVGEASYAAVPTSCESIAGEGETVGGLLDWSRLLNWPGEGAQTLRFQVGSNKITFKQFKTSPR